MTDKLTLVKNKLKDSAIDNGDLKLKPSRFFGFTVAVFYKQRKLGTLSSSSSASEVKALVKEAQRFCPELFVVKVSEYYKIQINKNVSYLGQVCDLYTDNNKELIYVVKDLLTGEPQFYTHSQMVDNATRLYKVG